jgi:tetratricopeptide (TPR) repeat protein
MSLAPFPSLKPLTMTPPLPLPYPAAAGSVATGPQNRPAWTTLPTVDSASFYLKTASPVHSTSYSLAPKATQPVPINQAQIYYALGERYYQSNRFTHALDAFTDSLVLNPDDYRAYNKRGVVKATLKDYAGAFADYSKSIALQPNFYNAYINRGNLWDYLSEIARKAGNTYISRQSAQRALADFSQAIRINPWNEVAYENRSELYTNLGMHTAALQDKGRAIQLQPSKGPHAMGLPFCPPRIALVLANDDYDGVENDLNGGPVRDATRMANQLRSQGFYVITGANLTGLQTKAKVAEFVTKLLENPNAVSLTYYSGHGGSINGNNYIIPTNFGGTMDPNFSNDAVSVDYLLKQLKATNSFFNMIFLDACRTPLPEGNAAFKSARPALKQWETEPGPGLSNTWIEYASRPKQPAMQENSEGLYTKYLLQYMNRPDLNLKEVSMYTSYALESDPTAIQENQHSRTQTDLSRTKPIAEAFSFAQPCVEKPAPLSTPPGMMQPRLEPGL